MNVQNSNGKRETERYLLVKKVHLRGDSRELPAKQDGLIASGVGLVCLVCAIILLTLIITFLRSWLAYNG
jgi:hypothetical protein